MDLGFFFVGGKRGAPRNVESIKYDVKRTHQGCQGGQKGSKISYTLDFFKIFLQNLIFTSIDLHSRYILAPLSSPESHHVVHLRV